MSSARQDWELQAAGDPRTHPQLLSDIATRRPELRGIIAANPSAFAELRSWIAAVDSGVQAQQPVSQWPAAPAVAAPPVRARRGGAGWWFAGCGCLTLVVLVVLGVVFAGGALISGSGGASSGGTSSTSSDEEYIGEQMAIVATERQRFHELAAQLEGNPVAPLVTEFAKSQRLDKRIAEGPGNRFQAESLANDATKMREILEQRFAEAEARRGNASGTVSEALVEEAGNGFIDIVWDAATACSVSGREGRTTAGCTSDDPLAVHILPERELFGDWGVRITTLHELAHLYQNADLEERMSEDMSAAMAIIEQGFFEGSGEKLADCYALTYTGGWTLENEQGSRGYGYVCNESERQAIREWAALINAPMP